MKKSHEEWLRNKIFEDFMELVNRKSNWKMNLITYEGGLELFHKWLQEEIKTWPKIKDEDLVLKNIDGLDIYYEK